MKSTRIPPPSDVLPTEKHADVTRVNTIMDKKQTFVIGGMGHPTTGPGNAGKWTKQPGMLGYAEICVNIKTEDWNVVGSSVGTYATDRQSKQWVGYDSMSDVEKKAR